MSESRALRSRFFGVLAVCAAAVGLVGLVAGGCGGSVNDGGAAPQDTGTGADTTVAADSTGADAPKDAADTSKPAVDSEVRYDAPGSLFDVDIPDLTFDGGTTAGGCYDCTKTKCKDELAACDKDERCRGIVLCITVSCAGTTDFTCALGCAADFGVTSPSDPVALEALAVGQCTQKNCGDKCPIPSTGDGGATDAKRDGASDTSSTADASDAREAGPAFKPGSGPAGTPMMSTDPQLGEMLMQLSQSFDGHPEMRQAVIDRLTH